MTPQPNRLLPKFSLEFLLGTIVTLAVCMAIWAEANQYAISWSEGSKVTVGMSKDEVLSVVGKPHLRFSDDAWGYRIWTYQSMRVEFQDDAVRDISFF